MKKIKLCMILMLLGVSLKSFSGDCEMINDLKLDDFYFELVNNDLSVSPLDAKKIKKVSVELKDVSISKSLLKGKIVLGNNRKNPCNNISFQVEPIKLCKDTNGGYEPWRFVTCPDSSFCWTQAASGMKEYESISVVSLKSETDKAKMSNVKICGETKITSPDGMVFIRDSYLGPEIEEL